LPNAEDPKIQEWIKVIEDFNPKEDDVIVGHSRGGVAVLRYLEQARIDLKVKKILLIATSV
jgi:predicted alpha/beta hydrolase family esterase